MSVPLSDTRLAEIRERAAAATTGPWRATEATDACVSTIHSKGEHGKLLGRVAADADAAFIAHAREDLPALLAEVKRLRAVVEDHGREAVQYEADYDRLRADMQRIQRWATTTVHGSAAAEVLLLIRNLPNAPVWNCFTDEAYRSSLTDSPERPCDRVQAHPAHKHVAQRASWQCPGVVAPSV